MHHPCWATTPRAKPAPTPEVASSSKLAPIADVKFIQEKPEDGGYQLGCGFCDHHGAMPFGGPVVVSTGEQKDQSLAAGSGTWLGCIRYAIRLRICSDVRLSSKPSGIGD